MTGAIGTNGINGTAPGALTGPAPALARRRLKDIYLSILARVGRVHEIPCR